MPLPSYTNFLFMCSSVPLVHLSLPNPIHTSHYLYLYVYNMPKKLVAKMDPTFLKNCFDNTSPFFHGFLKHLVVI